MMSRFYLVALILFVASRSGAQTGASFALAATTPTGSAPGGIATGDLVGSALPDIVVVRASTNDVRVLQNLGSYQTSVVGDFAVGSGPFDVVVVDIDGDGDGDILTGNAADVSVLLNQGNGAFSRADYGVVDSGSLAAIDINGDGVPDIVRGSQFTLATAPGVFGPALALPSAPGVSVARGVGDFDGDGDIDVVHLTGSGAFLQTSVFFNDGSGGFSSAVTNSLYGLVTPRIAIADMDADGIDDLVTTSWLPSNSSPDLMIRTHLGDGVGGFAAQAPRVILAVSAGAGFYSESTSPVIADVNGDGTLDVFVRHMWTSVVGPPYYTLFTSFFVQTGGGRFRESALVSFVNTGPSHAGSLAFAAADVDADGDSDIVQGTGDTHPLPNATIETHVATPIPLAPIPAHNLMSVGPTNIVLSNAPFASALIGPTVRVTDSAGQPQSGVAVTMDIVASAATAGVLFNPVRQTDAAGEAVFSVFNGTGSGVVTLRASLSNGSAVFFSIDVRPVTLLLTSGNNQSVVFNGHPPVPITPILPLVTQVIDSNTGLGVSGVVVRFTHALPIAPFSSATDVMTDATGQASFSFVPSIVQSNLQVIATITGQAGITFSMNMTGPSVIVISGSNQATDLGDAFFHPFEAQALDAFGNPEPGVPVTFAPVGIGNALILTPQPVVTDANGKAIAYASSSTVGGSIGIRASVDGSALVANFSPFVRLLSITSQFFPPTLTVTYQHEHGPQPFIYAIDAPQSAPTTTPFGVVHTSILSPAPTLLVADIAGTFGLLDLTLIANPTFTRSYAIPPGIGGLMIVVQVYGYDFSYYPNALESVFVSNAVYKTF